MPYATMSAARLQSSSESSLYSLSGFSSPGIAIDPSICGAATTSRSSKIGHGHSSLGAAVARVSRTRMASVLLPWQGEANKAGVGMQTTLACGGPRGEASCTASNGVNRRFFDPSVADGGPPGEVASSDLPPPPSDTDAVVRNGVCGVGDVTPRSQWSFLNTHLRFGDGSAVPTSSARRVTSKSSDMFRRRVRTIRDHICNHPRLGTIDAKVAEQFRATLN